MFGSDFVMSCFEFFVVDWLIFMSFNMSKIVNEYDQEIPQSQTADNPLTP